MRRPSVRSLAGGAAGIAAGVIGGISLTSLSVAGPPAPGADIGVEASHLPPVLTLPGEAVRLRYAIACRPRDDGEPCDGSGEVYVRAGQRGPFQRLALTRGPDSREGRYFVDLPSSIADSEHGFSYYAVLRDESSGETVTLPSGGASAPQRSVPLRHAVQIELGAHAFGQTRRPDARPVSARWGSGLGEAGLAGSRELGFVGPSAFDVDASGRVTLLDQVNGRAEHWRGGRPAGATPLAVTGGLADFAVEPNGSLDVLEPPDRLSPVPVLRSFRADGSRKWAQELADRTWAKLLVGPAGPVVQQQPSEQWRPVADHGRALGRAAQAAHGRTGRPLANGREVVVERQGVSEIRIAEVAGDAVLDSWRIVGSTPLGEVQLAEPLGSRLVAVVKTYTDARAEDVVLLFDHTGIVQRFSVQRQEWAESAPLARFRLAGSSLYHLGSAPSGAFVDRFDLEVER
jgi:hypothetical protein